MLIVLSGLLLAWRNGELLAFWPLEDNGVADDEGLLAVDLLEELGRGRTLPQNTIGFLRLAYGNRFCGNFTKEVTEDWVLRGEVRDRGQQGALGALAALALLLLEDVLALGEGGLVLGGSLHDGVGEHGGVKGELVGATVGHVHLEEGGAGPDGGPVIAIAVGVRLAEGREAVAGEEDAGSLVGHAWGLHHDALEVASAFEEELDVGQVGGLEEVIEVGLVQEDKLGGNGVLAADEGVLALSKEQVLGHEDLAEEASHEGLAAVGGSIEPYGALLGVLAQHEGVGHGLYQPSVASLGGESSGTGDRVRQGVCLAELLEGLSHGFLLAGGSGVGDEVVTEGGEER